MYNIKAGLLMKYITNQFCFLYVWYKKEDEYVTLNVKDFGAKGDGQTDDTMFIQCAINACPKGGRVYIPAGVYKIYPLYLKSDLVLEIGKDATLSAFTDREKFPILPGKIECVDTEKEYLLGTWEGDPLDMFAAIITGINVEDCLFLHTDRGLRIKTRRGRGKDAIVTGIRLCLFVCINYYSVEEL